MVVVAVAANAVVSAAVVVASVAVNAVVSALANALVNAITAMALQRAKRHAANAKSAQRVVVSNAVAIAMSRVPRTQLQLVKKTATNRVKSAANAVAEVVVVRRARHANKMPTVKCKTKMRQRETRQQHAATSRVPRVSANNARRAVVVAMVAAKVARVAMVAVSATQKPMPTTP